MKHKNGRNKSLNVGFVSTRFKGLDGVSLEASKWADVLEGFHHRSFWFAGELDKDTAVSIDARSQVDRLPQLGVHLEVQRRVDLLQSAQGVAQLVLVTLGFRDESHRVEWIGQLDTLEDHGSVFQAQGLARSAVLEFRRGAHAPALAPTDRRSSSGHPSRGRG